MALSYRIFGTIETIPSLEEIADYLEEGDFDVTIECEEEDVEEWTELFIYEEALEGGPARLFRIEDSDAIEEELSVVLNMLGKNGDSAEFKELRHQLSNCVVVYGIELQDGDEDDNALLLTCLAAQCLAQKADGVYTVDTDGIFSDDGELIYERG